MTAAVTAHPRAGYAKADLVAWLLGHACTACGTKLPAPGHPCTSCGKIPDVTAPELEEQLDSPRALAAVSAAKLRAEGEALRDQALAKYREADRVLVMHGLHEIRAEAQAALEAELAREPEVKKPWRAAQRAEEKAARDLAAVRRDYDGIARDEETARRMKHGLRAEAEAAVLLDKAGGTLRSYQDALADATRKREAAEAALAGYRAGVARLEQARDTAVSVCDSPGRIPYSIETIEADLARVPMSGQLDELEMTMARPTVRVLGMVTGASEAIEAEARRQLLAEQEKGARDRPLHLQPLGDGGVSATPNPLHPGTPQPYHPPGPGAGPAPGFPLVQRLGS
jgi:hypothetical protein